MSSVPSSVTEVCGKDPAQVIDYLIAGSHRGLNSLIYSLRDDLTRHFPHIAPSVIEKVPNRQTFERIRHESEVEFEKRSKLFGEMVELNVFSMPERPIFELAVPPTPQPAPAIKDSLKSLVQSLADARAKNEVLKRETARGQAVLSQLQELQTLKREKAALEKQVEARDRELEKFNVFSDSS